MSDNDPTGATGYEKTEVFHRVTDVLKCKWAIAILNMLEDPRRPTQIIDALPGLTSKVLNDRLRKLESYGLISREVFPEVPPRVEYKLSMSGCELRNVLHELIAYIDRWSEEEASARCS